MTYEIQERNFAGKTHRIPSCRQEDEEMLWK
jgi:hypothetical protein